MDLCLNEILVVGNIIPEDICPGVTTAAAAEVNYILTVSQARVSFNRQACPFL